MNLSTEPFCLCLSSLAARVVGWGCDKVELVSQGGRAVSCRAFRLASCVQVLCGTQSS